LGNSTPLGRHVLYADEEEVHAAAWPRSAAQTQDIARFIALEGGFSSSGERLDVRRDIALDPIRIAAPRYRFDPVLATSELLCSVSSLQRPVNVA
jgi:hypothetical protein